MYKRCELCEILNRSSFSCFFTHATEQQQREVFEAAARGANEDQKKIIR